MDEWTAYYCNNPDDDYNLILEILHNEIDVAIIYQSKNELILKYYANEKDMLIPLDWLLAVLSDAKKSLVISRDI